MNENEITFKVENTPDWGSLSIKQPEPYVFDFDKINTVEDVIAILKGMDITIYSGYDSFDKLKPYLKPKDNE